MACHITFPTDLIAPLKWIHTMCQMTVPIEVDTYCVPDMVLVTEIHFLITSFYATLRRKCKFHFWMKNPSLWRLTNVSMITDFSMAEPRIKSKSM